MGILMDGCVKGHNNPSIRVNGCNNSFLRVNGFTTSPMKVNEYTDPYIKVNAFINPESNKFIQVHGYLSCERDQYAKFNECIYPGFNECREVNGHTGVDEGIEVSGCAFQDQLHNASGCIDTDQCNRINKYTSTYLYTGFRGCTSTNQHNGVHECTDTNQYNGVNECTYMENDRCQEVNECTSSKFYSSAMFNKSPNNDQVHKASHNISLSYDLKANSHARSNQDSAVLFRKVNGQPFPIYSNTDNGNKFNGSRNHDYDRPSTDCVIDMSGITEQDVWSNGCSQDLGQRINEFNSDILHCNPGVTEYKIENNSCINEYNIERNQVVNSIHSSEGNGYDSIKNQGIKKYTFIQNQEVNGYDSMLNQNVNSYNSTQNQEIDEYSSIQNQEVNGCDSMQNRSVNGRYSILIHEVFGCDSIQNPEVNECDSIQINSYVGDQDFEINKFSDLYIGQCQKVNDRVEINASTSKRNIDVNECTSDQSIEVNECTSDQSVQVNECTKDQSIKVYECASDQIVEDNECTDDQNLEVNGCTNNPSQQVNKFTAGKSQEIKKITHDDKICSGTCQRRNQNSESLEREHRNGGGQSKRKRKILRRTERRNCAIDLGKHIQELRPLLIKHIECEFGLLDALVSAEVLTSDQSTDVLSLTTTRERNDLLLDILLQSSDVRLWEKFLTALQESNQSHMVQLINCKGKVDQSDEDRILTDGELRKLQRLTSYIVGQLEPVDSGLIDDLYSQNCLNEQQLYYIREGPTIHHKNRRLLEVLRRRSRSQLTQFIHSLRSTGHQHVADSIEYGQVMTAIDAIIEPVHKNSTADATGLRGFNLPSVSPPSKTSNSSVNECESTFQFRQPATDKMCHSMSTIYPHTSLTSGDGACQFRSLPVGQASKYGQMDLPSGAMLSYQNCRRKCNASAAALEGNELRFGYNNVPHKEHCTSGTSRCLTEPSSSRSTSVTRFSANNMTNDDFRKDTRSLYQVDSADLLTLNEVTSFSNVTALSDFSDMNSLSSSNSLVSSSFTSNNMFSMSSSNSSLNPNESLLSSSSNVQDISPEVILHYLQEEICNSYSTLSPDQFRSNLQTLLQVHSIHLSGMQPHRSIRMFFQVANLESLQALRDILEDGQLGARVEEMFNGLLRSAGIEQAVRVRMIYLHDYQECAEQLKVDMTERAGVYECHSAKDKSKYDLHDLPDVLLDDILLKSVIHEHNTAWRRRARPTAAIFNKMASVCLHWFDCLGAKQLVCRIQRLLYNEDCVRLKKLGSIRVDGAVLALTQLSDRIYLSINSASCADLISLYDSQTLRHVDNLKFKAASRQTSVTDMAACPINKCIYMYDFNNETVWKLTEHWEVQKWLETPSRTPLTVTVTPDGRVLLMQDKPGTPRLEIYDSTATCIHTLILPKDLNVLDHTLEKPMGSFVIAHGYTDARLHWISELAQNGRQMRTYGGRLRLENGQRLKGPSHLAVDGRGNVLVADLRLGKVLLLDKKRLRLRRILLDEEDVVSPQRLALMVPSSRLLVGSKEGIIGVYHVRFK